MSEIAVLEVPRSRCISAIAGTCMLSPMGCTMETRMSRPMGATTSASAGAVSVVAACLSGPARPPAKALAV